MMNTNKQEIKYNSANQNNLIRFKASYQVNNYFPFINLSSSSAYLINVLFTSFIDLIKFS